MRTVSAKVSDELYKRIKDIADKKGITISEAIKQSVMSAKIESKKDKQKILYELNRIGNNLNQIARYANAKKTLDIVILEELKVIEDLIRKCANDL